MIWSPDTVAVPDPSLTLAPTIVSPRASGSMSLPSTGIDTPTPWVVRAWSATAVGAGTFGSVTVTVTFADALAPAESVTVYPMS